MSVTFTASANATPASGTVVATCVVGTEHYQLMIPAGTDGAPIGGAAATPLYTSACVTNLPGSAIGGPLFVAEVRSAGSAAGSPLFTLQTNATGSAVGAPTFVSLTNVAGSAVGSPFFVAEVRAAGSAAGSPLFVSACVTNQAGSAAGSPLFASITNLAGSAAGSPLFVAQAASGAHAWSTMIRDGDGNRYGVGSGSPLYITGGAAGGTSLTDQDVYAEDSAAFTPTGGVFLDSAVALTASQAGAARMTAYRAGHVNLRDAAGNQLGVTGSPLVITGGAAGGTSATDQGEFGEATGTYTPVGGMFQDAAVALTASQAGTVRMTAQRALHTSLRDSAGNAQGAGPGSPFYVSACVTNAVGSAIGTPLFVAEVRAAGSAAGSPLFVSACITNLAGSAAGSPLFVTPTNIPGSALGTPIFSSLTNIGGSAIGSPFFVAEVRAAGSAAGSPIFSSITNLAGSATGSPLFVRVGDGTDTAFVDAASRLAVALTDGANAYGLAGSPLPIVPVVNQMYFGGSLLTVNQAIISSSAAGCTVIVASLNGFATVVVGARFTTSSCQLIGWTACGDGGGGASAAVQLPMPFGTNGGMTERDLLWQFPSGSGAAITTTSACYVRGLLNFLRVAS